MGFTRKNSQVSAWLDFEGRQVHPKSSTPWLQSFLDGKPFERVTSCPVLIPDRKDPSEAKYTLNSAVIKLDGEIMLPGNLRVKDSLVQVYRADAKDDISTLKIATSTDGINWTKHGQALPNPSATIHYEDPRITVMSGDGRIIMLSTRADKERHIASIDINELVGGKFVYLCTVNKEKEEDSDKDGVLFPDKINGRYALLRRPWPYIKIAYADSLSGPWDLDQTVLMAPRRDMLDNGWIGGGSVPILTDLGWFMIYHGVEYHGIPENKVYRIFGALLDKENPGDPSKVLRSSIPLLEPKLKWEKMGGPVPNVIFDCNAVEIKNALWTWYSGADWKIGIAKRD